MTVASPAVGESVVAELTLRTVFALEPIQTNALAGLVVAFVVHRTLYVAFANLAALKNVQSVGTGGTVSTVLPGGVGRTFAFARLGVANLG